jgi:hypothetical protein
MILLRFRDHAHGEVFSCDQALALRELGPCAAYEPRDRGVGTACGRHRLARRGIGGFEARGEVGFLDVRSSQLRDRGAQRRRLRFGRRRVEGALDARKVGALHCRARRRRIAPPL